MESQAKMLKVIVLFLSICLTFSVSGESPKKRKGAFNDNNIMDVSDFSIYYNPKTNQSIKDMLPRPWYKPGWLLRLPFTGAPCSCDGLKCTCCTGIRIQTLNFDRRACTELTFEPMNSTLDMEVSMNGDKIYRNSFSARNLPPFCIPLPVPYLPPGLVDMCVRLFDISVMDQRLHVCMDWDTRIDMAPVLILHFDCMDMGFNGVGLSKPGGSPNPAEENPPTDMGQYDSDFYDPVTEKLQSTTVYPFNNTRKYI